MRRLPAFALLLALAAPCAAGDLVVIVNPASGVTKLSREQARNIFLGRSKYLPSGLVALPVEQVSPEDVRGRFYDRLVNLPLPQVRAYWARLYFTGQAQPPRQTGSTGETLEVVAANRGAIGFVDAGEVTSGVRVVLILP
jgi:ABC-type phosphate transport system substrate-binding protein